MLAYESCLMVAGRTCPCNSAVSIYSDNSIMDIAVPVFRNHTGRILLNKRTQSFKFTRTKRLLACMGNGSSERNNLRRSVSLVVAQGATNYPIKLENSETAFINSEDEGLSSQPSVNVNEDVDIEARVPSYMLMKGSKNSLRFLEEKDEWLLSKQMLSLCRSNKIKSALELFQSMEAFGLHPNLHACNSLLSCLLRNSLLDDALQVFNYMKTNKIISGHSYSMVLKAIANEKGTDTALNMFMDLEGENEHTKQFDVAVFNTMISICGKENNWIKMENMWNKMKEHCLVGTSITYRVLVCTFVRCGQYELAMDAYGEMLQHGIEPSVDAMHAMIGACSKEGKWEMALNVFHSMLSDEMNPNLIACNALINSLGKAGKVDLAFRVFAKVKSIGHSPDSHTWNSLLGALYNADRCANALRLFHKIRKKSGAELNIQLCNTALMCCQKLRLWEAALQILWLMESTGLSASTTSYNLVISTCETAGEPTVALQVFEHMVQQKCKPDTFTYLSLARSCIWESLWKEVEEILKLSSDVSLYNTVIQGMCLKGRIEPAKKLYMKMRDSGLSPDGKTRAMMLQHLRRVSSR